MLDPAPEFRPSGAAPRIVASWLLRICLAAAFLSAVAWLSTAGETFLALGLLIGWRLRWMALGSALLLCAFAMTVLAALGPKAPLDYLVFTAASAAFLLFAAQTDSRPGPQNTST